MINNLISFVGERFAFDAHYFAKNTFWLLIGQGMMSLAAFISTVVLANYVTKHDVGDYRLIVSIYSTIVFFSLSGIGVSLVHSIVNKKDGSLHEAIVIKKRYGFLAFLIGSLVAFYFWVVKGNPVFGSSVLLMAITLPFIEVYSLYAPYLQGKHEFKYVSLNTGLVKIISSLAIVIAIYFSPTTFYIVFAFYLSQVVVTYLQYKTILKKFPPENNFNDNNMVTYAKHLTFAGVATMLFGQVDKFIVYHFFGPVSLAQYWIASVIPQEVSRFINASSQVVYNKFINGDHESLKKNLPSRLKLITAVMLIIVIIYAFVAYPFFLVFFPQYLSEVSKSIVLMFAFVVTPYSFIWQFYIAKRNVKITYISNMFDHILQIILYAVLIPPFGIWGLVFAILTKTMIMNILAFHILKTN